MASGKEHHKSNKRLMLITIIPFVVFDGIHGLLMTAGLFLSLLITPDLDQHQIVTHNEKLILKYSKIIGTLFIWYWKPYAHCYSHRAFMSHAPIVGTLARVAYTSPLWFPFVYYCKIDAMLFLRVVGGLVLGDINHFRMDGIVSCITRWISDFRG